MLTIFFFSFSDNKIRSNSNNTPFKVPNIFRNNNNNAKGKP